MIYECIDRLAQLDKRGHTYLEAGGRSTYRSYAQLVELARTIQAGMIGRGLRQGDRVALVADNAGSFIPAFLGGVMAGLVIVPISPPPLVGDRGASYAQQIRRILTVTEARAIVVPADMEQRAPSLFGALPAIAYEALAAATDRRIPPAAMTSDDVCFLQFTSGSTGDPKGVIVTHGNVAANVRAIMVDGVGINDDDVGVSWLPLFHDMGLIGKVLAPLIHSTEMVYLPTSSFIKNPNGWLEAVSRHKGSITFASNFAFALATKHFKRRPKPLSLSSLRVVGCGAEPINADVLRDFIDTFAPYGLRAEAVMPCYGMAEATLAVSFDSLQHPPREISIDRHIYEIEHRVAPATRGTDAEHCVRLVACGRPFPLHQLAIVDQYRDALPEGWVGQIAVRGPSLTTGYYRNPVATASTYIDGWLMTGDLGFMLDGELYVSGRIKDLIIVNGRNYYPQDLEWVVEQVTGVRRGSVAAFATAGQDTEQVVIVAEVKRNEQYDELSAAIRSEVSGKAGLVVDEIVLVPPGTLPKSTSGKIQRQRARGQYQQGEFRALMEEEAEESAV